MPAVEALLAFDLKQVRRHARKVGFPLVLKTAMPEILHKSDVGGVITNIRSIEELDAAYRDLAVRLGHLAIVQPQIDLSEGVELFLGATPDEQFGPLVTIGFGGTLIEVLKDTLTFLAPVLASEVLDRLPDLRGFEVLTGARGKKSVDLEVLSQLVADFSLLAYVLAGNGLQVDANPVFASGSTMTILDALIVPSGDSC